MPRVELYLVYDSHFTSLKFPYLKAKAVLGLSPSTNLEAISEETLHQQFIKMLTENSGEDGQVKWVELFFLVNNLSIVMGPIFLDIIGLKWEFLFYQ